MSLTSQFWIGTVDSEDRFADFIAENDEYWSEENEDSGEIPLTRFLASQGQTWYDHDFAEYGHSTKEGTVLEKFAGYSYINQWAHLVEAAMVDHKISSINVFIMIGIDEQPRFPPYRQIKKPRSHSEQGIELTYIGELTHEP